ncbi:MAG: type II toxin-antitoxin system VapC family toxin [Candidatus Dormibacteraceae bacterium]
MFVDTSALYAILDRDDANHAAAAAIFPTVLASGRVVTHSYVMVETAALVQHRLGMVAVRRLVDDLFGAVGVVWVDEQIHLSGVASLLAGGHGQISLVDYVSFDLMRRRGITSAFAFDADFARQGFELVQG